MWYNLNEFKNILNLASAYYDKIDLNIQQIDDDSFYQN